MAARVLQVMMTGALLVAVMGCGSSSVDSPASAGPRPHLLIVAQDPSGVYEVDSLALGQRQTLVRLGVLDRAAFSADQRGVAFIDDRGRLVVVGVDGRGRRQVAQEAISFSWSPDNRRLTYMTPPYAANPGIYVVNADGSGRELLEPESRYGDFEPAWSPDGRSIAFIRWTGREGDMEEPPGARIWLMDADGANPRVLSDPGRSPRELAWSPDGKWIAAVDNYEHSGVRIVGVTGRHVEKGWLNDFASLKPSWSPDGRLLAITSPDPYGGAYILSIINVAKVEGSVRRVVLLRHSSITNAGTAAWSRGGARIAIPVCGDAGSHLYTLRSDGSELREVTSLGRPLCQRHKLAAFGHRLAAFVVWR